MLTFRQLDDLPDAVMDIITATEREIINDMARRIAKVGTITETAQWQLSRLEAVGAERDYIMHHLNRALNMSERELIRLFDEAATRSLAVDDAIYHAAGYNPQPLADNTYMQQLIRAGLVKTLEEYRNLTLTTAATATGQFENALDLAYHKVASGGFSYQQAIRDGIRSLTRKGLATIQYPTGWVDYLDVAFRRATLTGVNQTTTELQIQRAAELETDIMELTAHHGARPEHAAWQGRLVSLSGKPGYLSLNDIGYGEVTGFKGANCQHDWFPFMEGLSDPAYSPEQLRQLNDRKVTYDGEEMSLYDATQKQRHIERKIRRWKREKDGFEAAGIDSSFATEKVRQWQATQRDFIDQTGLRRDYFRERAGKQNLETPSKSDIIKAAEKSILKVANMQGNLHLTPMPIDVDSLGFDDVHINSERGHGVTLEQAKRFIQNAKVSITKRQGMSENYIAVDGVAYVNPQTKQIKTAFTSAEFDDKIKKVLEEVKNYEQSSK